MRNIFKATIIVTIFAVLTRALGFFLRIYLSRVMGAEALGAYQITMSVFGVLLTIVSSGLPMIVSRNVAYFEAQKNKTSQNRTITAGLVIGIITSILICVVVFVLYVPLCKIIGDESANLILILLPAIVASAIYAILRGGLWGRKYFFSISFTEFFEQIARIVALVMLFNLPITMSSAGKSALSLTIATIASCVLVVILYFAFNGKFSSPKTELKTVLKSSTPITFVKSISSAIGSVIAMILPLRLMMFGYTHAEALAEFGIYMGMTMPIIMIPSTFISSICVALVPELSGYTNNIDNEKTDVSALKSNVTSAIKTTIAISSLLLAAFVAIGVPIGQVLFNNFKAGIYLSACAILMIPMGLSQIFSSILNSIGLEKKALLYYSAGAILLLFCIIFLPQFVGTYAIAIAMMLMHTTMSLLSAISLAKRKLIDWSVLFTVVLCLLICVPSGLLCYFVFNILTKFLPMFVVTCISGAVGVITTAILMFTFNVASFKITAFKFGKKLLKKRKI